MPRVPEPATVEAGAFERLFRTDTAARDNYRSRLFALFSEEVVRFWASNERATYRFIGRPTLWLGKEFATIDFALQRRSDGRLFVAEQKAELAWAGYSQLRLHSPAQVDRHRGKRAFDWFLDMAASPNRYLVKIDGRQTPVDGAILVWGAVTNDGRSAAMGSFGFADVLSLETMLSDLKAWEDVDWRSRVVELRTWTSGLFDDLIEESIPDESQVSDG
jgi:hypothetical protein